MKLFRATLIALSLLYTANSGAQNWHFPYRQYTPPAIKTDTVTLRFIGDVMLHTRQIETARQKDGTYRFDGYLAGIEEDLRNADLAVANMEFTLGGEPYSGYPCFSAPDSYADYAASCGIDIFLTANNHILDKGERGIRRTISKYDAMEREGRIMYTGCAKPGDNSRNPLTVIVKGIKIAIINFTYGTNCGGEKTGSPKVFRMNATEVLTALKKAKDSQSDLIIVCPHWGKEYTPTHSATQEKWARMLAENGADIIIGAHPHVIQDHGIITTSDGRNVPVYYSIGNAVSNMSATDTQLEMMVSIKLLRNYYDESCLERVSHDFLWCSRPGYLTSNFCTIKVKDWIGRRKEWKQGYGYDKMITSFARYEKNHNARRD